MDSQKTQISYVSDSNSKLLTAAIDIMTTTTNNKTNEKLSGKAIEDD